MKISKQEKNFREFLKFTASILFVTFITLYISQASGYYEYTAHKKTVFTSEQIKKFEEDILLGKDVHYEDYLEKNNKDYSNKVTKIGNNLSKDISNVVRNILEKTFKTLNRWMES